MDIRGFTEDEIDRLPATLLCNVYELGVTGAIYHCTCTIGEWLTNCEEDTFEEYGFEPIYENGSLIPTAVAKKMLTS